MSPHGMRAWCPRFRVAEGELTWDCRVIQDCRMVYGPPAQVSAPKQRSLVPQVLRSRRRANLGLSLGHTACGWSASNATVRCMSKLGSHRLSPNFCPLWTYRCNENPPGKAASRLICSPVMGWWNSRNRACRKYPPSPGRPGRFSRGWPDKPYRGSPTSGWPMDARWILI